MKHALFDLPKALQIISVAEPGMKDTNPDLQASVTSTLALKQINRSFSKRQKWEGGVVLFFCFDIFFACKNRKQFLEVPTGRACAPHRQIERGESSQEQ